MTALGLGAPTQAQPQSHGVQPWQAERAIKDFVKIFVSQQVITNDYSKVRVRISQVQRIYNKDVGWIVVAIFEGAVVPDVYSQTQTQTVYHRILKIAADKKGVVHEAVVNEGQGLMKSTARTSTLHDELPATLGTWTDWGGSPAATATPNVPAVTPGPSTGTQMPTSHGPRATIDKQITDLANQTRAAQATCNKTHDPKDCARYEALYKAYVAKVAEKAKGTR